MVKMKLKQIGINRVLVMKSVGFIQSDFPDIPIEITCEEANNIIDSYMEEGLK